MEKPSFRELDTKRQEAVLFAGLLLKWIGEKGTLQYRTPPHAFVTGLCGVLMSYCYDHGLDPFRELRDAHTDFPLHALGSQAPPPLT